MAPFVVTEFIGQQKSMLIAPAGYGKTYTIAECLLHTPGKSLVLTHTNAGVSALKEKFKARSIPPAKYQVETISSYVQKYVHSFVSPAAIPSQDNKRAYFPYIISAAITILQSPCVTKIIKSTYQDLFVDEYQDCTQSYHRIIMILSHYMRTHLMGDPLQGIFGFSRIDPLVDMTDVSQMGDFAKNSYELVTPWRWNNNGREDLGIQLGLLREQLIRQQNVNIDYAAYPAIIVHRIITDVLYVELPRIINDILGRYPNVLFIHPISTSTDPRVDFVRKFNNRIYILESLDDKDFYSLSRVFDEVTPDILLPTLSAVCGKLFGVTHTKEWITDERVKNRQGENRDLSLRLNEKVRFTTENFSRRNIASILEFFRTELKMPIARVDLLNSLITSLKEADENKCSVYEGMCNARNRLRRYGRKIHGHCIGTTLLTKGLECDCVVLLDIDAFTDYRHLYVALTRGSKDIIVIKLVPPEERQGNLF